MDDPAEKKVAALRLGAPVQFQDRWQGRVAAIEVDEGWEVINLIVKRGALRWSTSVKLPFSTASQWSDERVAFDCTSRQAFARELPPVAAPARTLFAPASLSPPGARLVGLLVEPGPRVATDVIIRHGAINNRVPVADVSFEGKVLHIATHGADLRLYLTDDALENLAGQALAAMRALTGQERHTVRVDVSGGVVTIRGNVLTKNTKRALEGAISGLADAAVIRIQVVDDLELELAIGQALERAGLHERAAVYARSVLGEVTLFGYAAKASAHEDIVRAVSGVPGVRAVKSRIEVSSEAATTGAA